MWRSLGVLGAATLLALIALWWGARRYLRDPVRALVAATERWREGDYAARANLRGGGSELVALGRAFDAMAESLEAHDRAREEAHAAARKVAEVFDCMTDSVFEVDRDWRITFMNERARIEVAQGQDQVGMNLWEAYPEGVDTGCGSSIIGPWRSGCRSRSRTTTRRTEMVPGARLPVARGLGLLCSGRHRAAAAPGGPGAPRALLETIIESTPDPIFTKDREGRYIIAELGGCPVRGRDAAHHRRVSRMPTCFPRRCRGGASGQGGRIMETGETEVLEERIPDRHRGETRVFLTTKTPLQ